MNLNRREELAEEAADCDQAAKDCITQRLYQDADRLQRRASEIRKLLDWELCREMWAEKAQENIAKIMQRGDL